MRMRKLTLQKTEKTEVEARLLVKDHRRSVFRVNSLTTDLYIFLPGCLLLLTSRLNVAVEY